MAGNRYELEKTLHAVRGMKTLLATDRDSGKQCVIKERFISSAVRERLEHDAALLKKIQSPLVAPVSHFEIEGNQLWLVRPYVSGTPLSSRLLGPPISVSEAIAIGRGALAALGAAHAHGLFHHNLKPGNVIISGSDTKQVVLTDFGLTFALEEGAGGEEIPLEAAWYISPEQAGLLARNILAGADLYSFGILFYQCFSGQLPFQGKNIGELLRKHLSEPPPRLQSFSSAAPRALDQLLDRLLRKDPQDRYQTAEAVEADLSQIGEAFERGETDIVVAIGSHDRRRTLTDAAFVGRDHEKNALDAALAQTLKGRGGLILLEGNSGGGKTALLNEFAQRCAQEGAWVAKSTGVDQTAPQPFQLLQGMCAELISAARSDPAFCADLQNRVGERRDVILSFLPTLKEILGEGSPQALGPEQYVEARSLTALGAFLDALGSAGRPVALLLDDCQWADELTLKALRYWQNQNIHGEDRNRHILVIASFRSEEAPADHLLRTIQPSSHVVLKPIGSEEIRALVRSMAGSIPEEVIETVVRLAQGSPFLAIAVLRGLVETGVLAAGSLGWEVDPKGIEEVQSSDQAADFLTRRLNHLSPEVLRFLSAGAVLGKTFDADLALELTGQAPLNGSPLIKEAEQKQIIWVDAKAKQCAFFHDKLREVLLAQLSEEARRRLHAEAALRIEQSDSSRIFEISYHFSSAGEWKRAFPYALGAAEEGRRRHALEVAEQHYRIAERGLKEQNRMTGHRVMEGLADVLMLRGQYDESIRRFEILRSSVEGRIEQAKINGKLGELFFKKGAVAAASEALQRALGLLGQKIPKYSPLLIAFLLWELLVQTLHTLFPPLFLARRPLDQGEKDLLTVRLFSRLAYVWWFERGAVPTLWAHLREMNLAERYPPTPELGQAYSNHAPCMTIIPYFRRGERYAEKSLAIRRELGDLWGQGQTLNFYGVALYAASRFPEALEKSREAFRLLDRTGDRWEAHVALFQVAASLYRMGDLRGAMEISRRVYRFGQELGETHASGLSVEFWAMASDGAVPEAVIDELMRRAKGDANTLQVLMMAKGICFLNQGNLDWAVSAFQEAQRTADGAGLKNEYIMSIPVWRATALRLQFEKTPDYQSRRRRALLCQAEKALRRGLRLARTFRNGLPHALREEGLLAAIRGRERAAQRRFNESLAEATRQGARYEYARTLLARAEVGLALGWPGADRELVDAKAALKSITVSLGRETEREGQKKEVRTAPSATLSLADRFSTLQEAGREIASALSRETVFAAARKAALTLLRGEACIVFDASIAAEDGRRRTPLKSILKMAREDALCRALIERAGREGRPVIYADDPINTDLQGAVHTDIRSALCSLIAVRGQVEACFYLTHRQVSGLFGEDEVRLAEFISILTGAALENADGFAKIQAFSRELEGRVAERTAELNQANREMEAFVYTASHDLKSPVVSIHGMASILMEDYGERLDDSGRRYMERILANAGFMEQLIADLLTLARVGRQETRAELLEADQVVREVLVHCEQAIQKRGAAVAVHSPLPKVTFDPTQLKQIFLNLISNAIKFMGEQPHPSIEIGGEEKEEEIEFYIRDNGIGIDPAHHEKVFEIFQRVKDVDVEGTGIGLGIVKKVIDAARGKIWIESKKGAGATFRFRIPKKLDPIKTKSENGP